MSPSLAWGAWVGIRRDNKYDNTASSITAKSKEVKSHKRNHHPPRNVSIPRIINSIKNVSKILCKHITIVLLSSRSRWTKAAPYTDTTSYLRDEKEMLKSSKVPRTWPAWTSASEHRKSRSGGVSMKRGLDHHTVWCPCFLTFCMAF